MHCESICVGCVCASGDQRPNSDVIPQVPSAFFFFYFYFWANLWSSQSSLIQPGWLSSGLPGPVFLCLLGLVLHTHNSCTTMLSFFLWVLGLKPRSSGCKACCFIASTFLLVLYPSLLWPTSAWREADLKCWTGVTLQWIPGCCKLAFRTQSGTEKPMAKGSR